MTEKFDELTPKERRLIRGIRKALDERWKTRISATPDDIHEVLKTITEIIPPARLSEFSNPDPQRIINLAVYGIDPYDGAAKEVWKQDKTPLHRLFAEHPPCSSPKDVMAWVLHQIHPSDVQVFLDALDEISPGIFKDFEHGIEPFDFLLKFDKYAICEVLREVNTRELGCALVDTSPEVKSLIFSNMSKRAAQMLKEDIEYIGDLDKGTVSISQKLIMLIARRLIAEGRIIETTDKRYTVYPPPPVDDGHCSEYEQPESIPPSKHPKPLLFKIILFCSLALLLSSIIVLVSWKVARMQLDMKDNPRPAAVNNTRNQLPGK